MKKAKYLLIFVKSKKPTTDDLINMGFIIASLGIIFVFFFMVVTLLLGCAGNGAGFDLVAFIKHPVIMVIIAIATLYVAFKYHRK